MANTLVTRETYCRAETDRTFHNAAKLAGESIASSTSAASPRWTDRRSYG
jgi:hypothetical protein